MCFELVCLYGVLQMVYFELVRYKWCVTNSVLHIVCYKWCVTHGMLQLVCYKWCVTNGVVLVKGMKPVYSLQTGSLSRCTRTHKRNCVLVLRIMTQGEYAYILKVHQIYIAN